MLCPYCGAYDTRVVDSRGARDGRAIRRRRECEGCRERFTTYEEIEDIRPDVLKKDGKREPFDPDKMLRSLRLACQKRPIELDVLTGFVDRLETRVGGVPRRSVPSKELGERVLEFLRGLDPVAYVRYASVYRSFDSVEAFLTELRGMQAEGDAGAAGPSDGA